jgi:hypothetical protein
MTDPNPAHSQGPAFLKVWDDYVAACQSLFERLSGGSSATVGGLGAPMPPAFLGPWKDFAASLGMPPDLGVGGQFKPEQLFASFLPGLGYSREYQEICRRMLELTTQFRRRYAEFAQQSADIGKSALHAVQQRGASDDTLRASPAAIYDAWIDSAEAAYAQAAHTEPFARLLADLCNILSAFKVERGKLLEALARQLDWPSRAEIDSLHRQVRSLTTAAAKAAAATQPAAARKAAAAKPAAASNTAATTRPAAITPAAAKAKSRKASKRGVK